MKVLGTTWSTHRKSCYLKYSNQMLLMKWKVKKKKVQLRVTYASCIPCRAGTSGGLCQHVLHYSFSCSTMHLSFLHQQRLSLAQIQSPVVRSYGGPETRCYAKVHHGNNGREVEGSIRKDVTHVTTLPFSTSDIAYVQTQYGEAPLGSVLSYQLVGSMDTFRELVIQTKERGNI